MRQSLLVLVPMTGLLLGSAASPVAKAQTSSSPAPERRCFAEQQIRNFRSTRTGVLYLKVWGSNSGTYQLSTSGGCFDLNTTQQVSIRPSMGSSRLCAGEWADVALPGSTGSPQVCRAMIEKKLTDAEIEAIPARDRP